MRQVGKKRQRLYLFSPLQLLGRRTRANESGPTGDWKGRCEPFTAVRVWKRHSGTYNFVCQLWWLALNVTLSQFRITQSGNDWWRACFDCLNLYGVTTPKCGPRLLVAADKREDEEFLSLAPWSPFYCQLASLLGLLRIPLVIPESAFPGFQLWLRASLSPGTPRVSGAPPPPQLSGTIRVLRRYPTSRIEQLLCAQTLWGR